MVVGEATITCRVGEDEQTEILSRGSVFGAIHMFEDLLIATDHSIFTPDILNVSIPQGTVLKISYRDFYEKVLLRANHRGKQMFVEEMASQSGSEAAPMITSQEDSLPLIITSRLEQKIPPKIFRFLNESKTLPPSFEYIFHGSRGRGFSIYDTSQPMLFIVVEGSLRLELVPKKKVESRYRITHVRDGQQPTEFKVE